MEILVMMISAATPWHVMKYSGTNKPLTFIIMVVYGSREFDQIMSILINCKPHTLLLRTDILLGTFILISAGTYISLLVLWQVHRSTALTLVVTSTNRIAVQQLYVLHMYVYMCVRTYTIHTIYSNYCI